MVQAKTDRQLDYGSMDYGIYLSWYVAMYFWIKAQGWIFGIIGYYIGRSIFENFLRIIFKMEVLLPADEVFFLEDHRQSGNIIAFQKVEKFETEKFRRGLLVKSFQFPRMKSKVVKFLGRVFFKQISEAEILRNINRCMVVKTGVHNEQQLADFMAIEQSIREPYDFLQWRVYIFQDYSPTESVFVLKVHHSVADGIAINLMNFNLQDTPNIKDVPKLTVGISAALKILLYSLLPLNILWCSFLTVVCLPKENNAFKNKQTVEKLSNVKQAAISPDIRIDMLQAKGKQLGGTLNDVLMTVLSLSLKEYLHRYTNDQETEQITLAFPFSMRPHLRSVLDFDFDNQFALLPLRLRLVENYEDGFKQIKSDMNKVKKSMTPFAMIFMLKAIMSMPHFIREAVMNDYSKRITFVISQVPGPRKSLRIAGSKTYSQGFFQPALKTLCGGISILSHADVVKICVSTDKAVMEHPSLLMDIITEQLDKLLGSGWR